MMQTVLAKSERITARINEDVKKLLAQAAELSGATLNQFLVQAALEKAHRIIEQDAVIYLSRRNSEWFFEILDNPPKPNKKLLQAMGTYKKGID